MEPQGQYLLLYQLKSILKNLQFFLKNSLLFIIFQNSEGFLDWVYNAGL